MHRFSREVFLSYISRGHARELERRSSVEATVQKSISEDAVVA